jgi:hypothetical protein
LLNYWFDTDHKLLTGAPFKYHRSQQEAIETLIFVWEYEKVRSRKASNDRYCGHRYTEFIHWIFGIAFFIGWMVESAIEHHREVAHQKRLRNWSE